MNDKDTFYSLRSGMFTTCSEIWDKERRKYRIAESDEIEECCLKQCEKSFEKCYNKYCNENTNAQGQKFNSLILENKCINTCSKRKKLCSEVCRLSSQYETMDNTYFQCSEKYNCIGIGNLPDKDCVAKHKDEIFQCCRKKCIPNENENCQKHCEYNQKTILNAKTSELELSDKKLQQLKSKFKIYPDNTSSYITKGIVLGIIIIFIWFIISKQM